MTQPRESHDLPQPLEAAIQNGANHDVPPEILNRARQRLDELRERMETREMETNRKHGILSLSTTWGRWLAIATPVAALLVAGLIFLNSAGTGGAAAYASAVRRLRTAENMVFTTIIQMKGMPEQRQEMTFKNTNVMRFDTSKGIYSVIDMNQKKLLVVDSEHKHATETNLSNLPPGQMQAQTDFIEHLRRLPEKASKPLGEKLLNGHLVNGFHIAENGAMTEVWLDAGTHELVQINGRYEKMPGVTTTMTNFRFNVPLAADFFSTAVPAGYKTTTMNLDMNKGEASAEDIAGLLETYSAFSPDFAFPATLNPAELVQVSQAFMKKQKEGKGNEANLPNHPYFEKHKNMKQEDVMRYSQRIARAMVFIVQAKPENDWHYAGEGVKFGDAKTPIAWWRPTGQKDYKVIFGDLSVKDVPAEDIPTAPGFKKVLPTPSPEAPARP